MKASRHRLRRGTNAINEHCLGHACSHPTRYSSATQPYTSVLPPVNVWSRILTSRELGHGLLFGMKNVATRTLLKISWKALQQPPLILRWIAAFVRWDEHHGYKLHDKVKQPMHDSLWVQRKDVNGNFISSISLGWKTPCFDCMPRDMLRVEPGENNTNIPRPSRSQTTWANIYRAIIMRFPTTVQARRSSTRDWIGYGICQYFNLYNDCVYRRSAASRRV